MIQFKYTPNNGIINLMRQEFIDINHDYLYGFLDEGYANQLNRCILYLCCDYTYKDGNHIYRNPIVIVAPNNVKALETYTTVTNGRQGFIHSELVRNCKDLEVETI